MFFSYGFCFAFIFRSVFGYFVPNSFPYGILFNYRNIPHTYDLSPVLVQVPNDVYSTLQGKHLGSNFLNDRFFETNLNDPSPVIVQDSDGASIMETNGELEGKRFGLNYLNKKLFKNVKSTLDVTFNKPKENPLVVKCRENFEGTLVNNECYKFFKEGLKWSEARYFCKDKGGSKADLWTPDTTDAFLYQKLSYLMPEFGTASNDVIWLGAKFDHKGKKIFDLNKEDITDTFQMNINVFHHEGDTDTNDECVGLGFYYGGFLAGSGDCDDKLSKLDFICEFPLDEDSKKGSSKKKKNVIRLFKNKLKF